MIIDAAKGWLLLVAFTCCPLLSQNDFPAAHLEQTEREFSKTAGLRGIRSAFLEYFDEECVVFDPRPKNGKLAIAADSDSHGTLVWKPTVVQVSASGDFGYTTGPSEFRQENSSVESAHCGHFVSVWRKRRDGQWKVILDVGSSYPKREKREELRRTSQLRLESGKGRTDASAEQSGLLRADSVCSSFAQTKGSFGALVRFGSEDVRLYRRGKFPAGRKEAASVLMPDERFSHCKFSGAQISASADLGFTYGLAVTARADTNNYIRVWRRENEWKVVIDVLNPWANRN